MQSRTGQCYAGSPCGHMQQQVPRITLAACSKQSLQLQWLIGCQVCSQSSRFWTHPCRRQTDMNFLASTQAIYNGIVSATNAQPQLVPGAAGAWQSNTCRHFLGTDGSTPTHRQLHRLVEMHQSVFHRPSVTAACASASPANHQTDHPSITPSSLIHPIELLPYPAAVDSHEQLLCDVLHVQPSDAQLLLLTAPAVITLTSDQLRSNWNKLQQLLPVKPHLLFKILLQFSNVLLEPKHVVSSRLQEASEVLRRPVHLISSRQHRLTPLLHWNLMRMEREQLVARLAQLEQLLGLQQQQQSSQQRHQQPAKQQGHSRQQTQQQWQMQQVVSLVCDEPRLLTVDQTHLVSSVEAIEQVCSWPIARLLPGLLRRPHLLMRPADKLYKAAAALQQQLKLSEEGLALVLKRVPGALLVSPSQLEALLLELSRSLAVAIEVAVDICLQEPQLLLRRPGAVGRVLAVMQSVYKLNSEELLQVVEFDPSILCRSAGELAASCEKFKWLAHTNKAWAAEYRRLMSRPVNVARALCIEPLRLQRLKFLQDQKLARTLSLKAAVSMSGRQFSRAYPGYKTWLAAEYSAGGVPRQLRGYREEQDEDSE